MGAPFGAAFGGEGVLQQGAEDGGFDIVPVFGGGLGEGGDFCRLQPQALGGFEEAAIEVAEFEVGGDAECAALHGGPEIGEEGDGAFGVFGCAGEEGGEGLGGQQAHGLGEHAEDAAHHEDGHHIARMAAFQPINGLFEGEGDVAGDAGAGGGGVEAGGVLPDGAEEGAGLAVAQGFEGDAVGAAVRKLGEIAGGAGEIGVDVEILADIAGDDEGGIFSEGGRLRA